MAPTCNTGPRQLPLASTAKPLKPLLPLWYSMEDGVHLIGQHCEQCGRYTFPPIASSCQNPQCDGHPLAGSRLSRTGTLWSYTNACQLPPAPYVPTGGFEPFAVAVVELQRERLIVLGQVSREFAVTQLKVGMPMELTGEVILEDEVAQYWVWKWRPSLGRP
jgi:uncharacterized protein